jgi:UDP-N-acetylglucosamine 2-epimerase (non-hydrolysing)
LRVVHLVAAARPNFMKVAPVYHALKATSWCDPVLVHTGQHYDPDMSDAFFMDLRLPKPHHHLGIGSGSHAEQTGGVMIAYEKIAMKSPPAWTVVVGDVNSTLACALAAKKLNLDVAHLEAGLRSGDRTMPEEINRIATDAISDLLWTPSEDADANLLREGVAAERISRVGNVMIDSFEMLRGRIEAEGTREAFGLARGGYGVVTLHRPSNVDRRETLERLLAALAQVAREIPLVFAMHPRTRKNLETFGMYDSLAASPGVHLTGPMGYIRFMGLVIDCGIAITDSGGIQEETTYLGIPCLTLRANTERPVTVTHGTNRLIDVDGLRAAALAAHKAGRSAGAAIPLWDGRTAGRVARDLGIRLGEIEETGGSASAKAG